jgi:hypothetical protein
MRMSLKKSEVIEQFVKNINSLQNKTYIHDEMETKSYTSLSWYEGKVSYAVYRKDGDKTNIYFIFAKSESSFNYYGIKGPEVIKYPEEAGYNTENHVMYFWFVDIEDKKINIFGSDIIILESVEIFDETLFQKSSNNMAGLELLL